MSLRTCERHGVSSSVVIVSCRRLLLFWMIVVEATLAVRCHFELKVGQ